MKHLLHKLIVWYLRRCAGAFHCYEYGPKGRYVVLMNEAQYHTHTHRDRPDAPPRCICKDFPGADEFCTAHKAPAYRSPFAGAPMKVLEWPKIPKVRQ